MSGRPVSLKEVLPEMPKPKSGPKVSLPSLSVITEDDEWKKPALTVGLIVAAALIIGGSYCLYRHFNKDSR